MNLPRMCLALCPVILHIGLSIASAGEPLAPRIDQLIESSQTGPLASIAGDAEFLRRIMLDLHGMIPTSAESRAFIDDESANKREILVDRLLASPRFAIHMAGVFDVMLMERRNDKYVTTPEWQKYLQMAFAKNTPFDQLAREILVSDGTDANLRPAAKFFLDRDAEPHVMTRDVGRIFFGIDLQCAQCHDHPLVEHYLQTDYYGLFAFVNRTVVFADDVAKKSFLGEKSEGEASYKSVFTQDAGRIRPQLPGENEIDEPRFHQGEDYIAAPLPKVRPIPKFSRRAKLAELATNGSNRQFNVNIANRLWAHMIGRGLVHPVDLHHPQNPPSHPAVLELVAMEFVAMKYDIRGFLRELALTKTYQRSIEPPSTDINQQLVAAAAQLPQLTAEIAAARAAADESRKIHDAVQTEFKAARTALSTVETAWQTTEAAVTAAKKPVDDLRVALAKSEDDAKAKQAAVSAITEAAAKSNEAAKLLPNDKEIAAAVATFTTKQQQLTGELAVVQKTIADQTAAIQPLLAKLVETYVPADAAYANYVEARKPVDAAKAKLIAIWNQHKLDSLTAAIIKKRLEGAQSLVNYQSALASVMATRAALESHQQELAAAVRAVGEQQIQLTNQGGVVAGIEKTQIEAIKQSDEAKAQLTAKQSVVQAVAEALTKTDAALQKLPGDVDLTEASQKLKSRLEPLMGEATVLEQSVANREAVTKDLSAKMTASKETLNAMTNEMTIRQQSVTARTNTVNQATAAVNGAESSVVSARNQLVDLWTNNADIRTLKQISPEQMTWALMQATGMLDSQRAVAEAEIEKTVPKASVVNDVVQLTSRDLKVEQQLNEQMRGHSGQIVALFAASAGQPQDDFFATPDQALFFANGSSVIGWAAGGLVAQRLMPLSDAKAFAEELYMSTLTRRPTEVEINEAAQYMASRPNERPQAIRELIWSLLSSAEFRFNH